MERPETPPSFFEVLMVGEENVDVENFVPMDLPDPPPSIPTCVAEDLENICRDIGADEETVNCHQSQQDSLPRPLQLQPHSTTPAKAH